MTTLSFTLAGPGADTAARDLASLLAGPDALPAIETVAPAASAGTRSPDPATLISLGSLVLSLPATVLTGLDIVDRIRKRKQAADAIARAQTGATQGLVILLQAAPDAAPVPLATLTPDQLLELAAKAAAAGKPDAS
ncbi:hypothetical protein [Derxia lacustris]|uniref:hypothetical protein n=1 Tax=Derxia lacustris TaxID=764842 RepID=UPI000A176A40|nr:hypothetical protein [Derxia lacustris]